MRFGATAAFRVEVQDASREDRWGSTERSQSIGVASKSASLAAWVQGVSFEQTISMPKAPSRSEFPTWLDQL